MNSFELQKEQKRNEERKRSMPFRDYWHLYLSLIGTGILTAFAGIYLGLAPSANGDIVFLSTWDMVRRLFFALYYALSFLLVAEGATLFAKDKLLSRDVEVVDGNITDIKAQRQSMTAMLWVSVLAIAMTTVAAGYILASWLHALDEFVSIPTAAQTWVVIGPPALLVFDAVMALIYQQNSKQSELDRWVQQQKRMAEANAQETFARTYVNAYNEVAPEAAAAAARASAMTDARRWGGASVQSLPVTPSHDLPKPSFTENLTPIISRDMEKPRIISEEEIDKVRKLKEKGYNAAVWPEPDSIVMEEPQAVIPVFEPQHPDENHGTESTEVMEKIPLPESTEAGADQNSPM